MANVPYQAGLRFGHALAIQQVRDVMDKLFHPAVINSLTIVLDRISMPPLPFEITSPRAALVAAPGPASRALHPDPVTGGLLAIPPLPMYVEAPGPPHPAPEPCLPATPTHHHTSGALHSTASCLPDSSARGDSEELTPAPPVRRRGRTARDAPSALVKEEVQEDAAPVQPVRRGVRTTRSQVSYAEPSLAAAELEDAHEAYVPRPGRQSKHGLCSETLLDSGSEDAAPVQPARKRGRPRKNIAPPETLVMADPKQEEEEGEATAEEDLTPVQAPKKRGRGGRPRKNVVPAETLVAADLKQEEQEEEEAPAPKRGRLSTTASSPEATVEEKLAPAQALKKRGRPRKVPPSQVGRSVLVPFEGKLVDQKMKRGRGRKKVVVSDTDTSTAETHGVAAKHEDSEW
ncbi:uncharacterized protein H6S33_011834 [Morchella sextelata]|uniref:uncharacterized protein n=1 Tax=Morchella sextelata TaxID=1174677 RepID=UPI001D057429|nr:uncharacterized protein H6S33_011834 [Morchella sextelata]KAH0610307.1 hypothetical protein H6S33_011834 [Morchella sextelata]